MFHSASESSAGQKDDGKRALSNSKKQSNQRVQERLLWFTVAREPRPFAGLDEDAVFKLGNQSFTISYFGGDGNDVVITAIPTSVLDFGTAPESYGTQLADDGARHIAIGPALGAGRGIDDGLVSHSIIVGHASEQTVMVQNAPAGAKLVLG